MATYKAGDMVAIRNDLEGNTRYDGLFCNMEMASHRGTTVTISCVWNKSRNYKRHDYSILEDGGRWMWTDAMFEGVTGEPVSLDISDIL